MTTTDNKTTDEPHQIVGISKPDQKGHTMTTAITSATDASFNPGVGSKETNTAFPHRPDYQRSGLDTAEPASVSARRGTSPDSVDRAFQTVTETAAALEQYLDGIDSERYTQSGLQDQIQAFAATDAYQALDAALDDVRVLQQQADANVAKVWADLSPDGDTAAELRATRYWNRTKSLLDSRDDGNLIAAAHKIIGEAGQREIGVLLQEVGPYLDSRGVGSDWVEAEIARIIPEYSAAKKQATRAAKAVAITTHNVQSVKRSLGINAVGQYRRPVFVDPKVI